MAVVRVSPGNGATWFGLSTDTKPLKNADQPGPKPGDRFVAVDTGAVYVFGPFGANGVNAWSTQVTGAIFTTGS